MIRLIDYDQGPNLFCTFPHRFKLFSGINVPDGIVRIEQDNYSRVFVDGSDYLLYLERQIRLISNRDVLVAENVAVHPVHLKRWGDRDNFLPDLSKSFEQVSNRHIRSIRAH